jgi:hypothetical protein
MKLIDAFKAFWAVLTGADLVPMQQLVAMEAKFKQLEADLDKKAKAPKRDLFSEGAIYTLVLLQREGRMVDFLQETVDSYSDEQIGAAVRSIHAGGAKVLRENFGLTPVQDKEEGTSVEVPESYDPCEYKLTGNAPANPPFKGTLTHRGWKANSSFPERSDSVNPKIVQPAEVNC